MTDERTAQIVALPPNPSRWNLEQLAKGGVEDLALTEQGLDEWVGALDARPILEGELAELELATDEALGRIEPEPDF
jgi:hypothetical protein